MVQEQEVLTWTEKWGRTVLAAPPSQVVEISYGSPYSCSPQFPSASTFQALLGALPHG